MVDITLICVQFTVKQPPPQYHCFLLESGSTSITVPCDRNSGINSYFASLGSRGQRTVPGTLPFTPAAVDGAADPNKRECEAQFCGTGRSSIVMRGATDWPLPRRAVVEVV